MNVDMSIKILTSKIKSLNLRSEKGLKNDNRHDLTKMKVSRPRPILISLIYFTSCNWLLEGHFSKLRKSPIPSKSNVY